MSDDDLRDIEAEFTRAGYVLDGAAARRTKLSPSSAALGTRRVVAEPRPTLGLTETPD